MPELFGDHHGPSSASVPRDRRRPSLDLIRCSQLAERASGSLLHRVAGGDETVGRRAAAPSARPAAPQPAPPGGADRAAGHGAVLLGSRRRRRAEPPVESPPPDCSPRSGWSLPRGRRRPAPRGGEAPASSGSWWPTAVRPYLELSAEGGGSRPAASLRAARALPEWRAFRLTVRYVDGSTRARESDAYGRGRPRSAVRAASVPSSRAELGSVRSSRRPLGHGRRAADPARLRWGWRAGAKPYLAPWAGV